MYEVQVSAVVMLALLSVANMAEAVTATWEGDVSSDWAVGGNWDTGIAPTTTTDVVIDGNSGTNPILSSSTSIATLSIGQTTPSTLTYSNWNTSLIVLFGDTHIYGNGTITHADNSTGSEHRVNLQVLGNLIIDSGGIVTADKLGFDEGQGPGRGTDGGLAAGGGYGGRGGNVGANSGGLPYGSVTAPIDLGSGGGIDAVGTSGSGGGAIKLDVSGAITNNGTISANGENRIGDAAGGSGGSVHLLCTDLAGSGSITATGGNGHPTNRGGGGGGRIAIDCVGTYSYSGTISLSQGGGYPNLDNHLAAPGTLYMSNWNHMPSLISYGLALPVATYNFSGLDLVVSNGATFMLYGSTECTVRSLTLLNNSTMRCGGDTNLGNGVTVTAGNITVDSGCRIVADGFGFIEGQGPGKGAAGSLAAGGGYGGAGGAASGPGGTNYGSVTAPMDLGSGGGIDSVGTSGSGGAAIRLNVSGTITIDGLISANGMDHITGGGGSGGSVYITSRILSGSGTVTADAGTGHPTNRGGGGGGRIAIETQTDNMTAESPGTYTNYAGSTNGLITVNGGTGGTNNGDDGSFYLRIIPPSGAVIVIR